MRTDTDLVRAVLDGDAGAEEELVERYRRLILGLARSRYGFDDDEAEDVLQTTLTSLWHADRRALRAWRGQGKLSTYLAVIVCRQCRKRLNERQRLRGVRPAAVGPSAIDPALAEGPIAASDPADDALSSERRTELRRAMAELSPRDRLVLAWRFFDDRPPRELATQLGISAGAARKAVHDALGRLRRRLRTELFSEGGPEP